MEDPRYQPRAANPVIFIDADRLIPPLLVARGAGRGEKLNVASCDLHNKIRISPVVFSCLLVAVVDWATLGTASVKSLPGSSGPQRILGSNVQLN